MISRDVLSVAQIHAEVPFGEDIAPLSAEAGVERVRRGRKRVAVDAREHADRGRLADAVSIIDGAHPDQRMIVHLVDFDAHAQIVVVGDGAARTERHMRAIHHLGCRDGQALLQIDAHPIRVRTGIDEQLGSLYIAGVRGRVVVFGVIVAGVLGSAIANEARQP